MLNGLLHVSINGPPLRDAQGIVQQAAQVQTFLQSVVVLRYVCYFFNFFAAIEYTISLQLQNTC